MEDLKALITARVDNGAVVTKKLTMKSVNFGERDDNGRSTAIIRVNQKVPNMVQVNQAMIDKATEDAEHYESLVAGLKGEEKAEAQAKAAEARAYADSLELNAWVPGMTDVIFSSNYELLAILRNNPQTAQIADLCANSDELLKSIYSYAIASDLAEPVVAGATYNSIFSDNTSVVVNNTIYHTFFNVKFDDEALDFIDELKREYRRELLKQAMSASKDKKKSRRSSEDDDED